MEVGGEANKVVFLLALPPQQRQARSSLLACVKSEERERRGQSLFWPLGCWHRTWRGEGECVPVSPGGLRRRRGKRRGGSMEKSDTVDSILLRGCGQRREEEGLIIEWKTTEKKGKGEEIKGKGEVLP